MYESIEVQMAVIVVAVTLNEIPSLNEITRSSFCTLLVKRQPNSCPISNLVTTTTRRMASTRQPLSFACCCFHGQVPNRHLVVVFLLATDSLLHICRHCIGLELINWIRTRGMTLFAFHNRQRIPHFQPRWNPPRNEKPPSPSQQHEIWEMSVVFIRFFIGFLLNYSSLLVPVQCGGGFDLVLKRHTALSFREPTGLGQPLLHVLDARGVAGMGGQEFRRLSLLLLVAIGEVHYQR